MNLVDALSRLQTYTDQHIIYIKSSSFVDGSAEVAVMLPSEFENKKSEMADYSYFLEIAIVKDVISCWYDNAQKAPSRQQTSEAVIYYAENDAYLMPDE